MTCIRKSSIFILTGLTKKQSFSELIPHLLTPSISLEVLDIFAELDLHPSFVVLVLVLVKGPDLGL